MLPPLIDRQLAHSKPRSGERGFTMALVTVALVTIIAMAALSIDIGTLYQAKAEAQRAADAAALTAARMISISGITGDPGNVSSSWQTICGGTSSPATLAAINVAQQNLISGVAATSADVTVKYGGGSAGATSTNCTGAGAAFGVNPVVTVTVTSGKLPIFFARVFTLFPHGTFSNTTAVATATAEVFNSSNSASVAGSMIPVQPRCVKPLIIPNKDPTNGGNPFVSTATGAIYNPGVSPTGAIGETFNLTADCQHGQPNCHGGNLLANPPGTTNPNPTLQYLPALVQGTPTAVPSCATADTFQEAIAGCDQTTAYTCGVPAGSGTTQVDLTENPVNPHSQTGDTGTAMQCLINSTGLGATPQGQDQIDTGSFPFQIKAGSDNPLVQDGLAANNGILTTSSSIATLPIYDGTALGSGNQPEVTIVGFLQVFIQYLNGNGHPVIYVLNVSGCSNNASNSPVLGTSPVPIRLITPP
ncbi:MAG: pilus assembly protein TadG-related protein [Candidatus Sulfotelmatobacter sp.]